MQTDSLLSRLKGLKERIDATEAHVTLDLDHRRNQIVSFNLVSPKAFLHSSASQRDDTLKTAACSPISVCKASQLRE